MHTQKPTLHTLELVTLKKRSEVGENVVARVLEVPLVHPVATLKCRHGFRDSANVGV